MRQKKLFIDTGAWFALADKSDKYHKQAVQIYRNLLRDYQLSTTNLVISETYTLIQRAISNQAAIRFLDNIAASPRIIKVYSDNILEETAIEILRQYQDQDFSYTDAVSFAAMKQYEIKEAFAFDHHFVTAGFTLVP
jgi:predicted nucleic acid-binding protein